MAWKKILLEGDAAELTSATPAPTDGTAAAVGAATTAARANHVHALGPLVANLNFAQKEGTGLALHNAATAPNAATEVSGQIYFLTTDKHPYVWQTA